jgi:hypothetical protein
MGSNEFHFIHRLSISLTLFHPDDIVSPNMFLSCALIVNDDNRLPATLAGHERLQLQTPSPKHW